jgi:transcriptional regulator with XRE-family HTH domain
VQVTSQQVKAARALLGWTSIQLAEAAGVGKATIWRLESVDGPLGGESETVAKIVGALEAAGVEFLDDSRPGVRMRLKQVMAPVKRPRKAKAD